MRTLINLRDIDLGVTRDTILAIRVEPRGSNQKTPNFDRLLAQYDDLVTRVRALPGVRAASLSSVTPLGTNETQLEGDVIADSAGSGGSAAPADAPAPGFVPAPAPPPATEAATSDTPLHARWVQVFPEYFATLGVPVLAGRELVPADNDRAKPRVAVINETMAKRLFGSPAAAIGRPFFRTATFPGRPTPMVDRTGAFTIVGVAGDLHDSRLREPVGAVAY